MVGMHYHHPTINPLNTTIYITLKLMTNLVNSIPTCQKAFTNRWKFNELKKDDTLSLFFKMESAKSTEDLSNGSITEIFIQFKLKSWDVVKNKWVTRVTTFVNPQLYLTKTSTGKKNHQSMILKEHKFTLGFDQRVWTILLTRLLINKIDTNLGYSSFDELVDLIDSTIVKLLHYFEDFSSQQSYSIFEPILPLTDNV